ncbi:hypothetical protein Q765_07150 [Flavobacterium rivuli WB 3.3-2 = DSM 21788]|uniref:Polysaccharide biosynthesis protein n=1 Tax=Flavobacterium rivuli WB 3.3-2 = DSM 21788 TaxID=1121895 RepID=A0A0A2MGJ6_9FLAO|nr:hypothetical protein [Flavobacterium rivuli]KGO87435.1 hypothetical protein Q765_07150 [Flavobacterium rivuli WB 3.3-2 = DSM 21788]
MRYLFNFLPNKNYSFKKGLDAGKQISQVLLGQVSSQVIGFAISFLVVRNLSKPDYSIFTVLMSIQGMMNVLSSSGITIGFQKIAGTVWSDNAALSRLVKTARDIRTKVFFIALVFTNCYGYFIFYKQGVPFFESFFYLIAISFAVFPDVQKSFTRIILLLKKRIGAVQITEFIAQVIRLILIVGCITFLRKYFDIKVVLGASIIAAWVANIYINKRSEDFTDVRDVSVSEEYKATLIEYMKLNWHNAMFYTFKGQISIFLIGVYGSGENLASLGAITRYSMVFTIVSSLIVSIVIPAFARQQNKDKLIKFYFIALIGFIVFALFTLLLAYLLDDFLLSILGQGYRGYNTELFLVFVSGLVGVLTGLLQGLNYSKGWMKFNTYLSIPLDVFTLILGLVLFDITSIKGVLCMSTLTSSIGVLLIVANSIHGFRSLKVNVT